MKKPVMRCRFYILSALVALASCHAGQINWSLPYGTGHKQSNGSPLPDGMTFQLGVFDSTFSSSPPVTPVSDWPAKWRGLCTADYIASLDVLSGSYLVVSNAAPFTANVQLYAFGYKATSSTTAEVFLATDASWKMPGTNPMDFPVDFDLSTASTIIAGSVHTSNNGTWIQTASLSLSQNLPQYYTQWKWQNFTSSEITQSSVSGEFADPDGDGVANALEYLFGTDPKTRSIQTLYASGYSATQVAVTMPVQSASRVTWKLRESSNLTSWIDAPVQPTFSAASEQWQLISTVSQARKFWRVEATAVTP